jgi:predicted nucleic acid-binding protein
MSGYLLDTNVLSEVLRVRPTERVIQRLREVSEDQLFSSEICVMELRHGLARQPRRKPLWDRIESEVFTRVNVLAFDRRAALRAGEILADLELKSSPVGIEDVMIGTTALACGLTVVTRNVRHLSRIAGLNIVNWWE